MRILWHNVIALILMMLAVVVAVRKRHEIVGFLMTTEHIGRGGTFEEQTAGLVALGLVLVTILALVKILTHNNRRGG